MRKGHLPWAAVGVLACACSAAPSEDSSEPRERHAELLSAASCPAGSHVILGTDGDDTIVGTNGNDCIVAGDGDDRITGGNGDDLIFGGDGDDVISGENGNDRIDGGNGNDILLGDNGSDVLNGGGGNDVLRGDNGDDTLNGDGGDDVIVRGRGGDSVSGGSGADRCSGNPDCEAPERPAASPCSGDAACAAGERCVAGVCLACLSDSECDDDNVCTVDSCQPALGCRQVDVPNGTPCLDATVCDGAESCQAGSCTAGVPLVCDDGLFCNGSESCDATAGCQPGVPPAVPSDGIACTSDRCNEDADAIEHVADDSMCGSGFYCAASSGCLNIDECATNQDNCSADATCYDQVPGTNCDEYSCWQSGPFSCFCHAGYEGDGVTCAPRCDPLTVASGVERCVRARSDQTVDLRLSLLDSVYQAPYVQADEPHENYCGPTAIKNLLSWYGTDVDYDAIAGEMHTNTWDTGPIFGAVFALGPAVGCVDPLISCPIVAALISDLAVKAGTLPGDMRAALARRAPPGYTACIKSWDPSLESIRSSLAEGNPVVYLESQGGNLHWAVVTGLYQGPGLTVKVANSDNRDWDTFVTDWSLAPVGDDARRGILSALFGLHPYTMIRWIPSDQANGELCP